MVTNVESVTDRRQEVARKRLPGFVDDLLSGIKPLNEQNLRILYAEVRALTRNRIPMHMRTGGDVQTVDLRTRGELLVHLLEAESLPRQEIIDHFRLLYEVTSDQVMVGV